MTVQWTVNAVQSTQSINALHQYQQNQIKVVQDYLKMNGKNVIITIENRSEKNVINRKHRYPVMCEK